IVLKCIESCEPPPALLERAPWRWFQVRTGSSLAIPSYPLPAKFRYEKRSHISNEDPCNPREPSCDPEYHTETCRFCTRRSGRCRCRDRNDRPCGLPDHPLHFL